MMISKLRHYYDKNGRYLESVSDDSPASAIPPMATGFTLIRPESGRDAFDIASKTWMPYEPTAQEKRQKEFDEIGVGNEIDAIYKGVSLLLPDLQVAGVLSAETIAAFTPDKNAPVDTPGGWLGKVADIKARNPKP